MTHLSSFVFSKFWEVSRLIESRVKHVGTLPLGEVECGLRSKKLEEMLGTVSYQNITEELRKDYYSNSDHIDLSQQLGLTEFYQELSEREHVGFKNYSELLLQRWATLQSSLKIFYLDMAVKAL